MAKKPIEDDLLTGGSISEEEGKASKKAKKIKKDKADKAPKAKKGLAKRTVTIIKSVICVVVIVALLVTYVATGAVRKGFIASLSLPAQTLTGMTVTNGDQKANIKVNVYNFYYATTYNSLVSTQEQYEEYGIDPADIGLDVDFDKKLSSQEYTDDDTGETMTWEDHLQDLVLESIESTYTYYLAAVEANGGEDPEITEDQQEELEETLDSYESTANSYGYTLSGYLVSAMGKGVTEKVFRREATRQYIAENYQDELTSDFESREYTDDEVTAYRDENIESYETVDILLFEADSEDDAKAFADELNDDGSNFGELAAKYATDEFYQTAYEDETYLTELGVTRSMLTSKGYAIAQADEVEETEEDTDEETTDDTEEETEETYSGLDWIFSTDRNEGDVKQQSTSVVYIVEPVSVQDRNTVNVRHILIQPEIDDDASSITEATDEQWEAAYEEAQSILEEWKSGDADEDSFATLANENSADTGSNEDGGLYENVTTGEMVNTFSCWCFDDSRQPGDTAIVQSEYGYHIMYFVGENDQTVWYYNAASDLANEDGTSDSEQLEEDYTLKVHWFGSRYFEKDVDIDS